MGQSRRPDQPTRGQGRAQCGQRPRERGAVSTRARIRRHGGIAPVCAVALAGCWLVAAAAAMLSMPLAARAKQSARPRLVSGLPMVQVPGGVYRPLYATERDATEVAVPAFL